MSKARTHEQPLIWRDDDHGRKVIDKDQMLEDFEIALDDLAGNEAPPPIYEMTITLNGGGGAGEDVTGTVKVTVIQGEDESMTDVKVRAYEMARGACMDIEEITDADGNEVEDA